MGGGHKRGEKGRRGIGSNICKLHLVHVHLHWLASRPTLISFFSWTSPPHLPPLTFSNTRFSSSFHLSPSLSLPPPPIFLETHSIPLTKLVNTALRPFIIRLIPYLSFRSKTFDPRSILLIALFDIDRKKERKTQQIYPINEGGERGCGWKVGLIYLTRFIYFWNCEG